VRVLIVCCELCQIVAIPLAWENHAVNDISGMCQSAQGGRRNMLTELREGITKASRGPDAAGSREAKRSRSASKPD
jgi:hypothetical protein